MKTLVVFRVFKKGDVIALFPEIPGDCTGRYCESYQHIGQHGSADYDGLMSITRPATLDEYASLAGELQGAPYEYELDIRQRATRVSRSRRYAEIDRVYGGRTAVAAVV